MTDPKFKKRKQRRCVKNEVQKQLDMVDFIAFRCQSDWLEASHSLDDTITIKEFASEDFDCRRCSLYLKCLFAQRFEGHEKGYKFPWWEKELAERTFKSDESNTNI